MSIELSNTPYSEGTDTSNSTISPTGMEAEADNAIYVLRIIISSYEDETVILKAGGTERHRLYIGERGTGGIDYGNKPLRLAKNEAFTMTKAINANNPISYHIDYKRITR